MIHDSADDRLDGLDSPDQFTPDDRVDVAMDLGVDVLDDTIVDETTDVRADADDALDVVTDADAAVDVISPDSVPPVDIVEVADVGIDSGVCASLSDCDGDGLPDLVDPCPRRTDPAAISQNPLSLSDLAPWTVLGTWRNYTSSETTAVRAGVGAVGGGTVLFDLAPPSPVVDTVVVALEWSRALGTYAASYPVAHQGFAIVDRTRDPNDAIQTSIGRFVNDPNAGIGSVDLLYRPRGSGFTVTSASPVSPNLATTDFYRTYVRYTASGGSIQIRAEVLGPGASPAVTATQPLAPTGTLFGFSMAPAPAVIHSVRAWRVPVCP